LGLYFEHMGHLVLQGGGEFGGQMRASDLRAMALAGGYDAELSIVPAAAAPDRNHHRAGQNGRRWFQSLGARNVSVLPLIDRESAENPVIASRLRGSKLIYLLGGFPAYLVTVLWKSRSWEAIRAALNGDATVAGSSAGAMVMGSCFYDPVKQAVTKGLGILPETCIIPHFNTFGRQWIRRLQKELPLMTLIGIDEETGAIDDGPNRTWSVYGKGGVMLYRDHQIEEYGAGERFDLYGSSD
jgi:cyanophycinase